VEQYLVHLKERGIKYRLRTFYNSSTYEILHKQGFFFQKAFALVKFTLKRVVDVASASGYDVVFVHRESHPLL